MAPSAGGGFLRTALAAAAGVAGGSLLFQGIEGLLGRNAGPFGGGFGGGGSGFLGGGHGQQPEVIENNEVVNNYYGDNSRDDVVHPTGSGLFDDTPAASDAPAYQEADHETPPVDEPDYAPDDSSFDSGSDDFSGGGSDDSGSLV